MVTVERRAAVHAALGEPVRLAIVDRLGPGDASPGELADAVGVGSNLLAHHLKVLQEAGVIRRVRSEGDRRRSYVQLCLEDPIVGRPPRPGWPIGCRPLRCRGWCSCAPRTRHVPSWRPPGGTRSARCRPRRPAPTPRCGCTRGRPATGRRHGLRLGRVKPVGIEQVLQDGDLVVAVCDNVHEELGPAGTGCTGRSRTRCGSTPTRPSRPPMPTSPAGSTGWPRPSPHPSADPEPS